MSADLCWWAFKNNNNSNKDNVYGGILAPARVQFSSVQFSYRIYVSRSSIGSRD